MVSSSRATEQLALVDPAQEQVERGLDAGLLVWAATSRSPLGEQVDVGEQGDEATYSVSACCSALRVRRYAEQLPSGSPARRSTARCVRPRRPSSAITWSAASSSWRRRGLSTIGTAGLLGGL